MINIQDLTKRFGRVCALSQLTMSVERSQAVALWGSNGAGKTTLIRCMLGILRHQGEISVEGLNPRRDGKSVRRRIGYVPQELGFHDDMKLGIAMRFFARLRGESTERACAQLERVGLHGHEEKRVRDLSGGMKQRLALAIALLGEPPIIVLDEPTSNLDASGRADVVQSLRTLKQAGKTILFASHRPDEVASLADRVIVLERGKLMRDATVAEMWPSAAAIQSMRIHVADELVAQAAHVLRNAGHTVNLNGHGLCVAVMHGQKAKPIHVLAEARIKVSDFEFLDSVGDRETSR